MYLQKLEIQGFKSFAHKVSMSFNRGITSVVGPNGSGKSNVADAIRWVLGEQSMKLLRGKRAEDVIFAGSDKKNRLGSAEVSVFFNNEDGRAPVDASEFVITRRVFRTGDSEYLLNSRPTRLTDIALLLAKSNFGQRSYSIIGQGMIDEVLSATPQGRKVFFDEAAGVRAFQIKKEQAINKLDQTKENLSRVELLVKEIEPRLRSLTRQVHRLEQRSEIESALREHQDLYYRSLWHDVQGQLNTVKAQHVEKEKERANLESERSKIENDLRIEEARKTRDAEFEAMQKSFQTLVDQKNSLSREYAAVKGKRDAKLTASGKSNIVWLEKKQTELEKKQTELEDEIAELTSERADTENQQAENAQKTEELDRRTQDIEREIANMRQEAQAQVTLSEVSDRLQQLFAKHEQVLSRLLKAETVEQLASIRDEVKRFHDEFKSVVNKISHTRDQESVQQLTRLETTLDELTQSKQRLLADAQRISADIRIAEDREERLQDELQELTEEMHSVERELDEAKASGADRDEVLDAQEQELSKKIQLIEDEISRARLRLQDFNAQEQEKKNRLVELQKDFVRVGEQLSEVIRSMNQYAVDIARLETRSEDLDREMRQEVPTELIATIKATEPEDIDRGGVYGKILQHKKQLEMIGGIDPQVTSEYEDTKQRYDFLSHQLEDLQKAIADLEVAIEELDRTIKSQFTDAFQRINKEFGIYFKKLFGGGKASLELLKEEMFDDEEGKEDEKDEEEQPKKHGEKVVTGISIFATPPGKKLKSVGALSGGERALTSIALICAIISNNPSPFVVLDEVDAALDEANSERFASIINELSQRTQFITITHNRATMEHSSILYGVTMGDDGISKLLSVNIEHAEEIIKRHGNR